MLNSDPSNPRQKPNLLVPLYNTSPDVDQYKKCTNFLWRRAAEQGPGTVVFVNINKGLVFQTCLEALFYNPKLGIPQIDHWEFVLNNQKTDFEISNYLSCLKMLKMADVLVYIRVSMEYGFAMDIKGVIQGYHETYSEVISGYYLDHPPTDLSDKRVLDIIQTIKGLKRTNKVAISTHESEWNVKLLAHPNYKLRADLLVVFDSTHSRWNQACGRFGTGPYCRKLPDFKQRFDTILKRIVSGRSNRRQFAAIVHGQQQTAARKFS